MASQRNNLGIRLLSAFVIGFVTLTLEIAYTRVFSFKLFYYYTYFVIGVALLGLGAASAVTALSTRLRAVDTTRLVQWVAPAAALVGVAGTSWSPGCPPTSTRSGSDCWRSGRTGPQAPRALPVATAVFFGVGLILAALVVAEARDVRRLYFWDLIGAASAACWPSRCRHRSGRRR